MRSQEPLRSPGEDPHPGMRGTGRVGALSCCDAAALCSLGVSSSPFVSLLEFLWKPRTGGSVLHDVYSQRAGQVPCPCEREGNGSRCRPSLCESLALSGAVAQHSLTAFPPGQEKSRCFSGLAQGHSLQPPSKGRGASRISGAYAE